MKYLYLFAIALLSLACLSTPAQAQYPNGYGQTQNWHQALSPSDQQEFDKQYNKWVSASRKNDRDDINEAAHHMQDIMMRNNIPTGVSFDQLASNPVSAYPANGYPANGYPAQAGAYPYPANGGQRLSADDQRKFDDEYSKWVEDQRKNDQDDVRRHAGKMQEIMSRNGIPSNVPFQAIASNGYAAPVAAAPAYGYGQPVAQRLSSKDQEEFDKAYRHWMDARHKRDMDDVDKNARKMQEIMARYNIPANVSFDQIATVGAYH